MDEACVYQPTNQSAQIALLEERRGFNGQWLADGNGSNLRGVADLHGVIPVPADSNPERGNYAAIISTHPQYGTVYEVGWQRLTAAGNGYLTLGRRLYLWQDKAGRWHFLGEGEEEGYERGGETYIMATAVWKHGEKGKAPVEIRIISQDTQFEAYADGMEAFAKPDLTTCQEWSLSRDFPARIRLISWRYFILAEKGDTVEKIVDRVSAWDPTIGSDYGDAKGMKRKRYLKKALAVWRDELMKSNPNLPRNGRVPEGMRVELLTPEELDKILSRFKDS